jgi:SAM-dependent methyltransferase
MSTPSSVIRLGSFNNILRKLPAAPSSLSVLDVGCGYGNQLAHFGPESVGLELGSERLEQCRAKGLTVLKWSFTDPFPEEISQRRFDAVLLSHIIEHVFSPHTVLLEARRHLKPGGLLVVHCPVVNPLDRISKRLADRYGWTVGFHGPLFGDHVNFFTAKTLRYTCEIAGFETAYLGTPYLPRPLSRCVRPLLPALWYLGRKVEPYQYNHESCKALGDDGRLVWRI